MLSMDDLPPSTRAAVEGVVRRLVDRVIAIAAIALREAGLEVTLDVEQMDEYFDIVIRTNLSPEQHKLADEIVHAALESVILQSTVDGRLH
jgi:hypothetical protein